MSLGRAGAQRGVLWLGHQRLREGVARRPGAAPRLRPGFSDATQPADGFFCLDPMCCDAIGRFLFVSLFLAVAENVVSPFFPAVGF